MAEFRYVARELSGLQVEGTVSAASEREALGSLAAKNLFPVSINMADSAKAHHANKRRRVPARILTVFYTQLADLLRAGVPLLRSLDLLVKQTRQMTLKLVVQEVRDHVAETSLDSLDEDACSPLKGIAACFASRFTSEQVPVQPGLKISLERNLRLNNPFGSSAIRRDDM